MVDSEKHGLRGAELSGVKRWLAVATALVVFVFFVAYFSWPEQDTQAGDSISTNALLDDPDIQEAPEPEFPPRKLRQARYGSSAKDSKLIPRPENLSNDSRYVALSGEFDQWLLGTSVEVSVPQTGKRYRSIVDRIAPDQFGNTTIHAKPDSDEEEFQHLIVTYSSSQALAYVSTTLGSFELTGSEKGRWITTTHSLQKKRDYSQKDVLETQRDRHATTTRYVPQERIKLFGCIGTRLGWDFH